MRFGLSRRQFAALGAGLVLPDLTSLAGIGKSAEAMELPDVAPNLDVTVPQPLPDFHFLDAFGRRLTLAHFRGEGLVVNFWATWCHPCLAEMPELSQLDQRRADLSVLGLAYDDISPDQLKAFLAVHPVRYPIAQVDMFDPPQGFEAPAGLPTTYLLDRQGRIARRFVGPVTAQEIEQLVDGARDGRLP